MYQQLSNDVRNLFFSISIVLHYLLFFHPHAYCPMVAKWLLQLPYHIYIQQKANKEVTELINSPLQLFFSSTSKCYFSEISYHISHYQKLGHFGHLPTTEKPRNQVSAFSAPLLEGRKRENGSE